MARTGREWLTQGKQVWDVGLKARGWGDNTAAECSLKATLRNINCPFLVS